MKDYIIVLVFLLLYPVIKLLIFIKRRVMLIALKRGFNFLERLTLVADRKWQDYGKEEVNKFLKSMSRGLVTHG